MRQLPDVARRAFLHRCATLWLALALAGSAAAADSTSIRFRHLSREDGLSQAFVYAIEQDRQGYLWFGTQAGLNRFDGRRFTVFAADAAEPGALADDSVRTIHVDSAGTVWVGTDNGGLARFDESRQAFTNFLNDPDDATSIASDSVRVVFESDDGSLWVGTDGAGLERLDPDTGRFRHYPYDANDAAGLAGSQVWSIVQRQDGSVWVGTEGGLSRLDPDGNSFTNFRHDPDDAASISDNQVRALFEDADQVLWVGTAGGGLNRFNDEDGSFEHFRHQPDEPSSLSADRINTVYQDSAGVLWIGTVHGLNRWNPTTRDFASFTHDANDRYSVSHDNILSIFQDRGGVLWVGSYNGLSRWPFAGRAIAHYRHDPDDPRSLAEDTVTTFAENPEGTIWVGTFGGGLNRLDRRTGDFTALRHDAGDASSLSSDRVMALLSDSQGRLWAGTRDAGLNRYDAQRNAFERFRHDPADPASLSADGVTFILETDDGRLWVATFGGGLNVFDAGTQSFRHFRHDSDDPASLSSDRVLILFEDSSDQLWAGTYGGGLNRFDAATGRFEHFRADPQREDGLGGDEVFMIREDARSDFWIGVQGNGLYRWKKADREAGIARFRHFGELDGLPDAMIFSGEFDRAGNLWLSTGRGLSRLDIAQLEFRNFNTGHGLQGDEFNLAAGFRDSAGRLYFGGLNGFNAFLPERLDATTPPPPVAITAVNTLNEPVDLHRHRPGNGRLVLGHREHVVEFEFAALDFAAPENNRFRYRLDGLDKRWIDAGNSPRVTYTNLPAGDYVLEVQAANNDGVWSKQTATLDFRILQAPWATGWAWSAYILTFALLAAFWTRNLRSQIAARRQYTRDLQQLESRLSTAQRIGQVGNWEWDTATGQAWLSDQLYRLFQYPRDGAEAMRRADFLAFIHPDDRDEFRVAVDKATETHEPFSMDHRIVRGNGSTRFVHQRVEVAANRPDGSVRLAGTMIDITRRRKAEDAIRRQADYHNLLAELSADLIHAEPGRIDRTLDSSLPRVAAHFDLDAIDIIWRSDRESTWNYQWSRDQNREYAADIDYPWIFEKVRSGKPFRANDADTLPAAAARDSHMLEIRGIRSFLAMPLLADETAQGLVVFASCGRTHDWADPVIGELQLVADTLSGATARSRAEYELRELRDQLQEENIYLRAEVRLAHGFDDIVGEDAGLRRCLHAVETVAPTDLPVLLLGETGTGKELFARAIHRLSDRRDGPIVSVNCPALPKTLFESELFGHEKGAFTGAADRRKGRFELARGGTLFLDEIGELPIELQAKLLRVMQTGEFERVGGMETLRTDVRLIGATNRDLRKAVDEGVFRADLFYRIHTFPVTLPPLRDRQGDIPLLAKHFVRKHAAKLDKKIDRISTRMLSELAEYPWPGNVRELETTIQRAIISADSGSTLELPGPLRLINKLQQSTVSIDASAGSDLESVERSYISSVLERTGWKISGPNGASAVLGIPASTLRSKMKRFGISRQAN